MSVAAARINNQSIEPPDSRKAKPKCNPLDTFPLNVTWEAWSELQESYIRRSIFDGRWLDNTPISCVYLPMRSTSRFCSARCRVAFHRMEVAKERDDAATLQAMKMTAAEALTSMLENGGQE